MNKTSYIQTIEIPNLQEKSKRNDLLYSKGIELMSNDNLGLVQLHRGSQFVNKESLGLKNRHRFGVSFIQNDNISSRVISSGIKWISCEEINGTKL